MCLLFVCFFFYPIVPTLGYMINLCYMSGGHDYTSHKIEMFARVGCFFTSSSVILVILVLQVAHSISGCIEAPMQMVMVLWLIAKEYLPIPGQGVVQTSEMTDRFGNSFNFITAIPVVSMIFSFLNILSSSITINIFNVYIGQFKSKKSFFRYINLIGGYLPFFLNAVLFRITSWTFLFIFLDTKIFILVLLIWLNNILIGYITQGLHVVPKKISGQLKRAKSTYRLNVAHEPKIVNKTREKRDPEDTPVWLNSFLSLFVPTCYMKTVDPAIFEITEDMSTQEEEKTRKLEKAFFKSEKEFQRRVLKYQAMTSTTFLLISMAVVFYLVNYPVGNVIQENFGYNNNRMDNTTFKIVCGAIAGLGVLSYIFIRVVDVYDTLNMNGTSKSKSKDKKKKETEKGKSHPSMKLLVTLLFSILAVSPLLVGGYFTNQESGGPAYLVLKTSDNTRVSIKLYKADILKKINSSYTPVAGEITECYGKVKTNACEGNKNGILLLDNNCFEEIEKDNKESTCLNYHTIVLAKNENYRSSSPAPINTDKLSSPVLILNKKDGKIVRDLIEENKQKIVQDSKQDNKTGTEEIESDILYEDIADMKDIFQRHNSTLNLKSCKALSNEKIETGAKPTAMRKLYIGCDGNVKLKIDFNITCSRYGQDCEELKVWQRNEEAKPTKYEDCFGTEGNKGIAGPPIQCLPFTVWDNGTADNRESYEKDKSIPLLQLDDMATVCWKQEEKTYISMQKKSECRNKDEDEDRKQANECKKWGDWVKEDTNSRSCDTQKEENRYCDNSDQKPYNPFYKYRFCRSHNTNCVFMEVEETFLEKTSSSKNCTKPQTNSDWKRWNWGKPNC